MQQDDNQKVTVEDQELANMIAGLNAQASSSVPVPPVPPAPKPPVVPAPPAPKKADDFVAPPTPTPAPTTAPAPVSPVIPSSPSVFDLSGVKMDALNELRPLVSKLDLPPEEKFDTLLLLIRSTDDKSLVASAHEAAKKIENETRRANALLDIVKEIDFFEHPNS